MEAAATNKTPEKELFIYIIYMSFFVFFGVLFVLLNSTDCKKDLHHSELYDHVIQSYLPADFTLNAISLELDDNRAVEAFTNNGVTLMYVGVPPVIKTIANVKTIKFGINSSLSTDHFAYSNKITFMILVYLDEQLKSGYTHFISTIFDSTKVYSLQTNNHSNLSAKSFQTYNDGLVTKSVTPLVAQKWYTLTATFDGINHQTKIYINGILVKEGPCYNYGTYYGLTLNGLRTKNGNILAQSDLSYNLAMMQVWNATILTEADVFYYTMLYQNIYHVKLD